jgi:hypothetical protein
VLNNILLLPRFPLLTDLIGPQNIIIPDADLIFFFQHCFFMGGSFKSNLSLLITDYRVCPVLLTPHNKGSKGNELAKSFFIFSCIDLNSR